MLIYSMVGLWWSEASLRRGIGIESCSPAFFPLNVFFSPSCSFSLYNTQPFIFLYSLCSSLSISSLAFIPVLYHFMFLWSILSVSLTYLFLLSILSFCFCFSSLPVLIFFLFPALPVPIFFLFPILPVCQFFLFPALPVPLFFFFLSSSCSYILSVPSSSCSSIRAAQHLIPVISSQDLYCTIFHVQCVPRVF